MDEWRIVVRFPPRIRDFSSLQIVKTGFEAQPLLLSVYRDEGGGETLDERYEWLLRTSVFPKEFNIFIMNCSLLNLILDHNGRPRMDLQPVVCMKTCTRKKCSTLRPIYLHQRPTLEHPQPTQSQLPYCKRPSFGSKLNKRKSHSPVHFNRFVCASRLQTEW